MATSSTEMTIRRALLPRRRRGSTSPPLVGVESNPGPKNKASRRTAKQNANPYHPLSDEQRKRIKEYLEEGLTIAEISRRLNMKEEAVIRWKKRLEETGELKPRQSPGRPRKRSPEKENPEPKEPPRKRKRRKQMDERDHGKVEAYIDVGLTERTIGTIMNRDHTTIQKCKKKLRAGQPLPKEGARERTSPQDHRARRSALCPRSCEKSGCLRATGSSGGDRRGRPAGSGPTQRSNPSS